jgi:hypothetical protein
MNSFSSTPINTYEDIQRERERLEALIIFQKSVIRQDLDDLKTELKQEVKPMADAFSLGKKFISKESRKPTLFRIGANLLVDILLRKLFAKSSLLVQLTMPVLLKNYSSHAFAGLEKNLAKVRHNGTAKTIHKI